MARCTCAFFEVLTCASRPQSHPALSLAEVQIWELWVALFALGVAHAPVLLGICSCSSSWTLIGAAQPATSATFPFAPVSDYFRLHWLKI